MITITDNVADVREWFRMLKLQQEYVVDKSGCKMFEVVGATFIADENAIFGTVNDDYVQREIQWYKSMSRNVYDIPDGPPKEWIKCADKNGMINSNYGWMVWSDDNCKQYERAKKELLENPSSRRAVMIYTRPSMWNEYDSNGMSDFVCTNVVQYFVRDQKLCALVQMRSNDVLFGYKNDKAWQDHVHTMLANDLKCELGDMLWHAGSLHVYEKHFHLIK